MRLGWTNVALVLLCMPLLAFAQSPRQFVPELPVSRAELLRLRPVVEQDLRALIKRVYNDDSVSTKDVNDEFEQCKFTPLRLEKLGRVILVEAQAGHGATGNAAMVNLYAPKGSSYRHIVDALGFGPAVYPRPGLPPDLVFGWASGVCQATYNRYRYSDGKYAVDGCDQEYRGDGDISERCPIKACEGTRHYPTFPHPWPVTGDTDAKPAPKPSSYFPGPALTGKQILDKQESPH